MSSSRTLTVQDFDRICRICTGDENLSPICLILNNDLNVADLLEYCVMSDVKNELLPQNICEKCLENLLKVYEFKKHCQDVENNFVKLLETVNDEKNIDQDCKSNISLIQETIIKPDEDNVTDEDSKSNITLIEENLNCKNESNDVDKSTEENTTTSVKLNDFTTPYTCDICGKGFVKNISLYVHKRRKHFPDGLPQPMTYTCTHCGRDFKHLYFFNIHVQKHTSQASESEKPEMSRDHVCETCGRGYATQRVLIAHKLTHKEKAFLCTVCGRSFVTKPQLQSHSLTHSGEKPHTCNTCNKKFRQLSSLDKHMRVHSGERPYTCSICNKTFAQSHHFRSHQRRHNGEKPFSCRQCGKSFVVKSGLNRHIRSHTGERPNKCPVCEKGFYCAGTLKKHRQNEKSKCFNGEAEPREEPESEQAQALS